MRISRILQRASNIRSGRSCGAVVPAAGASVRMGKDKLYLDLGGIPVLARTLQALEDCPHIASIVVVTREAELERMERFLKLYGISKAAPPVAGGASRCESVYRGVMALPKGLTHVAVHDGARPLLSQQLLDRVLFRGMETGAAAPGIPLKDTIKSVRAGMVERTIPRAELTAVQTPQVFDIDLLKAALSQALSGDPEAVTDDCSAVEALGMKVSIVPGENRNLKITTPEDLIFAQALLQADPDSGAPDGKEREE